MQRAHVHEVGHLLGLNHVDVGQPHCPASGDTNASACYGIADNDMQSVMGSGMQLRLEHAYPWRESLRYFALEEIATAISSPIAFALSGGSLSLPVASLVSVWPAKRRRHYPRTEAEVRAGEEVTGRRARPH